MVISLQNSWNVPPARWGSLADVQYAIKTNAEKIYGIDSNAVSLSLPMFWGLPLLDSSGKNNHGTNHGATYAKDKLSFDGNDHVDFSSIGSFKDFVNTGSYTINLLVRTNLASTRQAIIGDWSVAGTAPSFAIEFGGYLQPANHITTLMGQITGAVYLDSGVTYNTNTFYPICVTYNSNTTAWIIYVQRYATQSAFGSWASGTNTTIGRAGDAVALYLNGDIKFLNVIKTDINSDQAALLNDLPYGLYQRVSRSFYLIPSPPAAGWTGKINSITNPAKINGVVVADIASVMGQ